MVNQIYQPTELFAMVQKSMQCGNEGSTHLNCQLIMNEIENPPPQQSIFNYQSKKILMKRSFRITNNQSRRNYPIIVQAISKFCTLLVVTQYSLLVFQGELGQLLYQGDISAEPILGAQITQAGTGIYYVNRIGYLLQLEINFYNLLVHVRETFPDCEKVIGLFNCLPFFQEYLIKNKNQSQFYIHANQPKTSLDLTLAYSLGVSDNDSIQSSPKCRSSQLIPMQ